MGSGKADVRKVLLKICMSLPVKCFNEGGIMRPPPSVHDQIREYCAYSCQLVPVQEECLLVELKFSGLGGLNWFGCFGNSLLLDDEGLWLIFEDDIVVGL